MSKICIIGPSKKFYSGLSACTIALSNALAQENQISVILLRNLLPRSLYPGKSHIGRTDYLLDFSPEVNVFDGMDWNSPVSWVKALAFLFKTKPDAVVMMWWTSSVAHMQLLLMLAGKLFLRKSLWILELHEIVDSLEQGIGIIRLYSRIMNWIEVRLADRLIVHSTAVKVQLAEMYHAGENRTSVIPVGLFEIYHRDLDSRIVRQELSISADFVVLYFGSVRKYKGVPFLIEAFNELPERVRDRSQLVIAGENWRDDSLISAAITASSARDHILYRPQFVPDDMVPKYFAAADVIVLPYLRTCGSAVINIAMACGKPIITTDLSTLRESAADYQGVTFVPTASPEAIARSVSELFDLKSRGELSSYPLPKHTWNYVAQRFVTLINMRQEKRRL